MKGWHIKALRYIAIIVVVVALLPLIVYFPPLQRKAVSYAEEWVSTHTAMQLTIGTFSLKYPLRVGLHDVVVVSHSDTLVDAGTIYADIALLPLLRSEVVVRKVELHTLTIDYISPDSSLHLRADIGGVSMNGGMDMREHTINGDVIQLDNSHVELHYRHHPGTLAQDTIRPDWNINLKDVSFSDVTFTMFMPPVIDTLHVELPGAYVTGVHVSLSEQVVSVQRVNIERGDYRYVSFPGDAPLHPDGEEVHSTDALPWQVSVEDVELSDNKVAYITSRDVPAEGLDITHILADEVDVSVSNVYNRGGELSLKLEELSLRERSGLCVKHAGGDLALQETGALSLNDFTLSTPFSDIKMDADVDITMLEHNPDATVSLIADARLSCKDAEYIYPEVSHMYIHEYDSSALSSLSDIFTMNIAVDGKARDMEIKQLNVKQWGVFSLTGRGRVAMPFSTHNRNVSLTCNLNTTDAVTLRNYIPDTLVASRIVLQPIDAHFDARLAGNEIDVLARLSSQGGVVDVNAVYDMLQEQYEARVDVDGLPVDKFLPRYSVGMLSALLQVKGQHFSLDNEAMGIDVLLVVDTLQYRNYRYQGIEAMACIDSGRWGAKVSGQQPAANMDVTVEGDFGKDFLSARMKARIGMIDLEALHMSQEPFDISGQVDAEVVLSNIDSIIQADIEVDKLIMGLGENRYYAQPISVIAASDVTYSYLDMRTGDLDVNISSDVGVTRLRPGLERLTQFVDTIFQKQRLNMDELHQGLPPFMLTFGMGGNNVLQRYLNNRGIRLVEARGEVTNDTLFNLSAYAQQVEVSGMTLDTITLDAHEKDERLNYRLALGNRAGNMDEFAHVRVEGFLSGNSTRLYCLQRNRKGDTGFMLGCKIDFMPDVVQLTFGPREPIIGYKHWSLNRDNYLTYTHSRRDIEADVQLSYEDSHLYVSTDDRRNKEVDGVHVDIQNIELSDWVVVSPLVTPMSGLLSTDVYIDVPEDGVEAIGTLDVIDFVYNNGRVGTFHADVEYTLDKRGGNDVKAAVLHDGNNVLDVVAYIDNNTPQGIDGNITIRELPLATINAFFPHNMGEFSGKLNSHLRLTGTVKSPQINGNIRFDDATMSFADIGASLSFDNTDIPIRNSRMSFSRYGIRGANQVPLLIDGVVDLSRLTDVGVNLDFRATNFQPIQIAENRTGIIYGSVYTDVDTRVRGTLSNLSVNGDVSLLAGTNATYVMQSNRMMSSVDYSEVINFVSFADTMSTRKDAEPMRRRGSMTANINIDIDPGVQLGVNLSPDGSNRIDLEGGGNLLYTSTALGDNRMTGRYNLTGGFVRYTPPFISQKIFNIEDGSYVSWNGNIAEPTFNITAVQSQRSTVKSGDDSRLVDFEVFIKISNTLKNLDVSFDLATTDDLVIENELQGLTPEQREAKAMNMFLYNSYDDLASAAENSLINNPLNTFLEYELNTWAQRTLRGVDLTFGIDNYGIDATGTQRTDYSYQFSKSLLDNRLKVVIGGSYASNQDVTQNLKENLIDDVSLEYRLTKRDNMYVKVFRQTGYESIIEGEITQTGVGFLFRKQVGSLLDLFRKKTRTTVVPDTITQQSDTVTIELPIEEPVTEEVKE